MSFMMGGQLGLLVFLSLSYVDPILTALPAYLGCYPESAGLHEFHTNPGVYHMDSFIPSTCVKRCFAHAPKSYRYAAIRHDSACLCSDSLGTYGSPDSTQCKSCTNEPSLTCGDNLFNSVYKVPDPIHFQGAQFDMPQDQVFNMSVVPTNTEIRSQLIHDGSVYGKYSFNYNDGYSDDPTSGNSSHVYRKPGIYLLQVEAIGAFDETFSYRTKVQVESYYISAKLTCPEYVIRLQDFECSMFTLIGDNMTVSIPMAPDAECYRDSIGLDYQGHVSHTSTGKTCQAWSSQSPNTHAFTDLGEHNYCRNPDSKPDGPWCYTIDPSTPWEYCDVAEPSDTCNIYDWPDSPITYLGSDIDKLISLPTVSIVSIYNEMYVKVEDDLVQNGVLIGIEAVVEIAGILEFRVFRPSRVDYCGINDTDVDSCRRPIKCSDYVGAQYSFTKQQCFNADGIINTDIPYDSDRFLLYNTYTFDTNGKTGRIYFPIDWDDRSRMRSGNLLSYNRAESTGKLAAVASAESRGDARFGVLSEFTLSQGLPKAPYQHLFRGVISQKTHSRLRLQYPGDWPIGAHDIDVSLQNRVLNRTWTATVIVTDVLYNVTVDVPEFVATNESITLLASVYDYAFSFTWDFDDGVILYNMSEAANHTWTTAGFYNLSVTAKHPFGDKSFTKVVRVEDPVDGFQWTDISHESPVFGIKPTAYGEDTKGYWLYTQGTDVALEARVFDSDDTNNTLYNFTLGMPGDQWITNETIMASSWNMDNLRATYDSQLYVGCFVDLPDRALPVAFLASPYMTHGMCFDHCLSLGLRFASLQNGGECYCGNAEIDKSVYQQRPDAECNIACAGDENSLCGGGLRNMLYEIEGYCSNNAVHGIEDTNVVPNSALTVSSTYSVFGEDYAAVRARLRTAQYSWCASSNDANQWIQIDLERYQYVSGIITQGCANYDRWVTKYSVEFSMNSDTPMEYVRDIQNGRQIFEANFDRSTPVTQHFDRPVRAKYVKIRPVEWVGMICLRFEILGCDMTEDAECFSIGDATDYRGYVSTTEHGKTCQKWTEQFPHLHTYGSTGDHNFCRNPSGDIRSWCYTNTFVRWEYCDELDSHLRCLKDTTIDGFMSFHVEEVTVFPVTIRAFNNVSESTLNALVYIQTPVRNLRTTPTTPSAFHENAEISYFIDDGTNITVTILSSDMKEPEICATNTYNGSCFIEPFENYLNAADYCFHITAYNLVSSSTILHCHSIHYGIQDLQVAASQEIFIPPDTVTFTIDAFAASHCNLTVDFGDDTPLLSDYIEEFNRTNGDNYITTYNYNTPGTYLVHVHLWNYVSSSTFEVPIYVQYPVDPLQITTTVSAFEFPASATSTNIELSNAFDGDLQPTGVTVNYTISEPMSIVHSRSTANNQTYPFVESIQVSEVGTYEISWYAYNKLSSKTGTITVDVDKPIEGLQIRPTGNPYGIIEEVLPFEIIVTWGSRITYTTSYGDNQQDIFSAAEGGHDLTHSWAAGGFYPLTVTAENTIGSVSYTFPQEIEICFPVEGIRIAARRLNMLTAQIQSECSVSVDVFIDKSATVPPDAIVQINFGNMAPTLSDELLTDFFLQINEADAKDTSLEKLGRTLTHFYTQAGVYTISIHVFNTATSLTATAEVLVYEEISGVVQNVKFTTAELPPSGAPDATFDREHFTDADLVGIPLDKAAILTVSQATGTGLSYQWDFGDGPDSLIATTQPRAAYWYQTPGTYYVSGNLSNPVHWHQAETVVVVEAPLTSVELNGPGPLAANTTFDFQIVTENVGTGVCYRIDFKDPASPLNRYALWGETASCERQYPDDFADAFLRFQEIDSMEMWQDQRAGKDVTINVTNHFMTIGTYQIQITASNLVSKVTSSLRQVVLKPDCFPPDVLVDENNRCNSYIPCNDGYREFKASETVIVYSRIQNKCKTSKAVWFSWQIYKVLDLATGHEELYNENLPNTTIFEGASLRDIAIQGPAFEYGMYRFEVNVSMMEEVDIYKLGHTYIHITKSPLVSKIVGGYYRSTKWNSFEYIDAITGTHDPDKTGEARKEGFEFTWFCRRVKYHHKTSNGTVVINEVETFETWNGDYTEKLQNGTVNQLFEDAKKPLDKYGCFGLSETGDIPLPGGQINQRDSMLILNTSSMYFDMEFEIKVIVKKDTRLAISYQTILVLEGEPPLMQVNCKVNCGDKCNPSNRYAVESEEQLGGSASFSLYFRWDISILLNDTIPPIWGALDRNDWLPHTSTGDQKVNFVIEAGFFQDNEVYLLQLIASRSPNFDNPVSQGHKEAYKAMIDMETKKTAISYCASQRKEHSITAQRLLMNDRPMEGECWMDKEIGEAMKTEFNLTCNGWSDPDEPLTYTFGLNSENPEKTPTILHHSHSPFMLKPIVVEQGLVAFNYTKTFFAKIADRYGAFTKVDGIEVAVMPRSKLGEKPESIAKELGGSVINSMTNLAGEGDAASVANLCASFAGELNLEATGDKESLAMTTAAPSTIATTTEDESYSWESSVVFSTAVPKTKEEIAEEQRLERSELRESMSKQVAKGASSASDIGAAQQLLSACVKLTQEPTEMTSKTSTSVMDVVDNLLDFTSDRSESSTAENIEETIQLVVESTGNCIDADLKQRESELTEGSEGENDVVLKQAERMLDKSMDLIFKQMVGGQRDMKVKTSRATLICGNTDLRELSNKTYDGGEGVKVNLPSVADFFGNDTLLNCFMKEQIQITKRSTKIFSSGGSNVNSLTTKVSFFNKTSGEPFIVENATEPIALTLTRNQDNKLKNETELVTLYNRTYPWGSKMTIHEADTFANHTLTVDVYSLGQEDMDCDFTYYYSIYVFFRMNANPSFLNHDHMCELTQAVTCVDQNIQAFNKTLVENGTASNEHVEESPFFDGFVKSTGDMRCFFSQANMSRYVGPLTTNNIFYFGVRHQLDDIIDSDGTTVQDQSDMPMHYGLRSFCLTCLAIGDDQDTEWSSDGCEVAAFSEPDKTTCRCNHLTTFGAGVQVPINKINLKESAFTKLDENPVAFVFMICCFCLYFMVIIWARKADQRDVVKAGVTPLPDNNPNDPYHYEITVFTGLKSGSGTSAKVSFILTGDLAESGVRKLRDTKREVFKRGGVDSFLVTSPVHLGSLIHTRIWHDNGGKSPSWFLSRLMVKDLAQDRVYYFMLDRWLAVEEDDGSIERVIPVAGKSELTAFGHLFYTKTRRNLSDSHLWFSVFARPSKSRFTRVQRATCCMSLLFTTMMSNIFFYNVDFVDSTAQQKVYQIGPIGFTMSEVVIGIIASLMVFPINLAVVQIFRITRPAPPNTCGCCSKKKKDEDGVSYQARNKATSPTVNEEEELQRQLDLLEEDEIKQGPIPSVSLEVGSRTNSTVSLPNENRSASVTAINMAPVMGFKKTKKKKKKFELPWGFLIVGWFLVVASILVAAWMVIEVAGTFGKQKATEWLTSMLISLVQDIFFTQPLKVLLIAGVVSLIFKDPEKEDSDEPPVPHLQNDEEWLHKELTQDELNDPKKMVDLEIEGVIEEEQEDPIEKPDDDAIQLARATRFKEMTMMKIVKEIIFYICFLNVTMLITMGERDQNAFYINKSLEDMFVTSSYHGKMQFSKILTKEQFWNYTENTFVPTLFDHTLYNGETDILAEEEHVVADLQLRLLGQARLRQVRIEPESCKLHPQVQDLVPECKSYFNLFDEETNTYDEFWVPYNESDPINYDEGFNRAWQYRKSSELNSSALWGRNAVYPGSGYAIELGSSLGEANAVISYLRDSLWIDQYTRAILLEFVMYNANVNMHSASALIVEMLPIGGTSPFTFFWTTRLDRYDGSFGIFVLAGQIIFALFILYFLQHEFRKAINEKKEYFKTPWNIVELITIGLSICGIGFYAYRYVVGRILMEDYIEYSPLMIDFHFFAQWDQLYGFMVGFVLFIATVKFMRILRFNRRILIFTMTLRNCAKDIGYYGIVFTLVFIAFACLAYGIYNKDMKDFSTIVRTIETLFSTVLGKFNFYEMKETNRVLGPVFFFSYVVAVVFILLNMFLSIINQSFSKVRHETNAIDGELEIVDFMIERFKRWTGFSEPRVKTEEKKFLYIEYVDPLDKACDELRLKLNDMVDELNSHIKKVRQEDSDYIFEDDYDYSSSRKKIFLSS